jgi:hypothetical protein
MRRYTLSLYRAQLRTAKFFDKNPFLKPLAGLSCLREELLGNFETNAEEDVTKARERRWASRVAKAVEQFRYAFLTRQERVDDINEIYNTKVDKTVLTNEENQIQQYAAHLHYTPHQSLASFVQMAYRQSAQGIVAPASAASLESKSDDIHTVEEIALDAAFAIQRHLKQASDFYTLLCDKTSTYSTSEISEFSKTNLPNLSTFVKGIITEAQSLSPGVLLIEHPTGARPVSSGNGHCALVLVYDISRNINELHNNEDWTVRGYVINRPFPKSVAEILYPQGGKEAESLGSFGRLEIYHGGMDEYSEGRISILHRFGELEGSAPINEDAGCPLYIGGSVIAINNLLDSGKALPSDFKVLLGAWSSKLQVDKQVERKRQDDETGNKISPVEDELSWPESPGWLQAQGNGVYEISMLPAQFDTTGNFRDGTGLGISDKVEGYNFGRFIHQNAAWTYCVRQLGQSIANEGILQEDNDEIIKRGKEINSWGNLHPAVVAYARAFGKEMVPMHYSEERNGTNAL